MKELFDNIVKELHNFSKSEFRKDYFTLIYGSFAYGVNTSNSDIDFVIICKKFSEKNLRNTINFTFNLYESYNLKIDDEVPHEKKILADYKKLEDAIWGKGFEKKDGKIHVPPVVKTKEFLESEEITMRLLLNAMTGKNIFVSGNKAHFLKMRRKALENLIRLNFSIHNASSFNTHGFVQSLIGTSERNGEMYLGYKDISEVREYLTKIFEKEFNKLVRKGILKKKNIEHYLTNYEWLNKIIYDYKRPYRF